MPERILLLDGHPDRDPKHFIHALAGAYGDGARAAGHEVRTVAIGELEFPVLRRPEDFYSGAVPEQVRASQESLLWADHLVILFPLWHGSMPAWLKAFLEQLLRPGFAFDQSQARRLPRKLLGRKSARIIVSMGMPAIVYRWYFGAHGSRSLQRSILEFCGLHPVRTTAIGAVEGSGSRRAAWLRRIGDLGRRGV